MWKPSLVVSSSRPGRWGTDLSGVGPGLQDAELRSRATSDPQTRVPDPSCVSVESLGEWQGGAWFQWGRGLGGRGPWGNKTHTGASSGRGGRHAHRRGQPEPRQSEGQSGRQRMFLAGVAATEREGTGPDPSQFQERPEVGAAVTGYFFRARHLPCLVSLCSPDRLRRRGPYFPHVQRGKSRLREVRRPVQGHVCN